MDEADLTKKAIDELMREMDEYKEMEKLPIERKKNPLGKPNKRFLGRTINSMLTHNKRQSDRNHQRCQKKLKELDAANKRQRPFRVQERPARRPSKSTSSHIISSASGEEEVTKKKSKSIKKKKKRRKKKKKSVASSSSSSSATSSSSSSSSETESSSTSSSNSSKHKNRKKKRHKKPVKSEEYEEDYYEEYPNETGYYVNPNMAYAVMAYNQMNHLLQQQQKAQQEMVKEELEDSVEIPSDLSLNEHSETSLNISLNSSSAEEDENGILTFNLSSDDEDDGKTNQKSKLTQSEIKNKTNDSPMESEDSDKESLQSYISLESQDSQKFVPKESEEICLLSSSASDSDDLEIVETVRDKTNIILENETNIKENATTINESINEETAQLGTILETEPKIAEQSTENGNINEVNENVKALENECEDNSSAITSNGLDLENTKQVLNDIEEKLNDEHVNTTTKKETLINITMVDLTDE